MPQTTNYQKHASKNVIQKFLINNFYTSLICVVKSAKPEKILDVGCGEGFTLIKFGRSKIGKIYEGVDSSRDAIRIGKKLYPSLNIKSGDIYNLEYQDGAFDLLVCTEVLEHLKNPEKALSELKRVTKKYIVFSVPNEPFFILANLARGKYLRGLGNHPEHINHWSHNGFKKFLRKNGLKVSNAKSPFPWTIVLARK